MIVTKLAVIYLSLILLISCSNCDVSEKIEKNEMEVASINEFVLQKFGKKGNVIKNSSNTFALCINNLSLQKPTQINKVDFFIYDLSANEIIFEDTLVNTNVNWESENIIVVTRIPGMIKKDDNSKDRFVNYRFDVKHKKKI